ncbi:hypothetical protein PISMIDRAFT_17849 [Pisolithus microcarpus 441]|uniref:Unplaced genomic scaffold scaffold_299, whole genome shotgun sequence n=1 Tax=Pisolithus microcarpus 441 TaxID=765257 RepID=A0A0C9YTM6_9AGAM|nr:hypothetical protein BKA83DRAFT_17849 [Pisolithus microcarpus]KIK13647.1 hypothetical protein PISMIDRAFT_17849 [Pisolithus microcarpus 441]
MSDWKQVYSEILSSYVGRYKEARGDSQLRNEILAEVKVEILQHEPEDSVALPLHLRVAIRTVFLPHLDPEDQDDEITIMQHILAVTRKSWEDGCEGEDAREEKAQPTKAGDYKKAFTAFTAAQKIFKEEMDAYDRERRDTKDPKTIRQRNRIIQQWWESVSDERKAEAGRAAEKWNKLGAPKETHDLFETAPGDGKRAFTESSEASKDWVLNGENILMDYLLAALEDSAEKHEVEISLDEDGNPEMPTWAGQKLKVQQNLARAVFQAAYAKFTKKPKAKVPWGLLIKSPMEYLDSQSIPEGFTMKDPSKWTKADLGLLWGHWGTLEAEEKVIVSFIGCKKEDAPLSWQFDRRPVGGSSKKREWMDPEDDSEEEIVRAGVQCSDAGPSRETVETGEVANKGVELTMDVGDKAPEESSPAWHATKDRIAYLKLLSIMSRYQVLVDLVVALPEERAEDVMDIVGLIVSRLEQSSAGTKEPKEGGEGAEMGGGDREDEEKEEEEAPAVIPTQKRKRAESGIMTRGKKVAKQDGEKEKEDGEKGRKNGENGKKGVRTWNQTRRTMGL